MKRIAGLLSMAAAAVMLSPASASADGFPAVACRYLSDSPTSNGFLWALNAGPSTATVACDANPASAPLGLDNPVEGEVNRVLVGDVLVLDNHPTEDISCRLFTVDRNGERLQTDAVTSSGTGVLQIGDPAVLQIEPNEPDARAALVCSVPGSFDGQLSGILSIFATSDFD